MTSQHIQIEQTQSLPKTREMRALVSQARAVQNAAVTLRDIVEQIVFGEDYAALATALGLTEQEAETVYNLLVAFHGAVTVGPYNAFIDLLG